MLSLAKWLDPTFARIVKIYVTLPGEIVPQAAAWIPEGIELVNDPFLEDDGSFDVLVTWGQNDLPRLVSRVHCPVIDVQHGAEPTPSWQSILIEVATRARLQFGITIAAVNEVCRSNFLESVRTDLVIIPNGADPDRLETTEPPEQTRRRAGIPPSAKVVLFLGRVSSEKNPQVLVDAAKQLPPEWYCLIVGPQNSGLERVGPRTRLITAEAAVGNWLAIANVVCQPSSYESHCLAINEAWLAGIPVVSCDYPVNRWFREQHGDLMWLVPVGPTAEQLAAAILQADRADPRVDRAREVAFREYTAEVMGRRWGDLIWSVCREPSHAIHR